MNTKHIINGAIKAVGDGNGAGEIEGYANVFGVIDSYRDVTMRGAFAQDLEEFMSKGYLAVDHEWEAGSAVGYIVEAREDDAGLWFRAAFHSTPDAQMLRQKIAERFAAGKEVGLSIGYYEIEGDDGERDGYPVHFIRRAKVKEVSVVFEQANKPSVVTAVKSRADQFGDLKTAVEAYCQRVADVNDLGRSETWKQERADELETLALLLSEAATALTLKEAEDDGDGDALAALALADADLILMENKR